MIKVFLIRYLLPFGLFLGSVMQVIPGLYILSPAEGEIVAGTVEIKGSVPDDNFDYAEVSYAFSGEDASNWFLIKRLDEPVHDATLALWDTTTITDGVYRLKVAVHRKNGSTDEIVLENMRVGNYTHYEEPTPIAGAAETGTLPTEEVTATPTSVQSPQPTDLPENPASIDREDLRFSLGSGILVTLLGLGILGVYAFFRNAARK